MEILQERRSDGLPGTAVACASATCRRLGLDPPPRSFHDSGVGGRRRQQIPGERGQVGAGWETGRVVEPCMHRTTGVDHEHRQLPRPGLIDDRGGAARTVSWGLVPNSD